MEALEWWLRSEPAIKVSSVAVLVALVSLGFAISSFITGRQALGLSRQQEERRLARLQIEYSKAYWSASDVGRAYVFDITVQNRSDSPNAVARAELWINYTLNKQQMRVVVPNVTSASEWAMKLPQAVGARDTIGGILEFIVPDEFLRSRVVRNFELELTDTFGVKRTVSAIHVPEKVATSEE